MDFSADDVDLLMSRFRFPIVLLLEGCPELEPALDRSSQRNYAILKRSILIGTDNSVVFGSGFFTDWTGFFQSSLNCVVSDI